MRARSLSLAFAFVLVTACTEQPLDVVPDPQYTRQTSRSGAPLPATQVAAGAGHACALGVDRITYCWGANDAGQLGTGSSEASSVPVPVSGGHRFVTITAGGWHHTCGLTPEGEAWCWGQNWFGQLGDGTTDDRDVPVRAAPNLLFRTLDAGTYHTCGIATDGVTYCWGANADGVEGPLSSSWAFGTETTTKCRNRSSYRGGEWYCSPAPVVVPGPRFLSVQAGLWATCGLTAEGAAFCTGWNQLGALGNGTGQNAASMTAVAGGWTFDALDLGAAVGCALSGGTARCWGNTLLGTGATGAGTSYGSATPTLVAGGLSFSMIRPSNANDIYSLTCGLTPSGSAYCWGANRFGGLGTKAPTVDCPLGASVACSPVPVPVEGPRSGFIDLAVGREYACGVGRDRAVYCWGANESGQLGDGSVENAPTPVKVLAPGSRGRRPTQGSTGALSTLVG